MKKVLSLFAIALICFTACKNKKEVSKDTSAEEVEQKSDPFPSSEKSMMMLSKGSNLIEKHWKAIEIMGKPVAEVEGLKQAPYVKFSGNGDIIAHGGCNGIFGHYELGMKNFIVMDQLSQTEMACEGTHFDADLIEALTLGKQYNVIGEDRLHIILGKRAPLGVFMAVYPEEGK